MKKTNPLIASFLIILFLNSCGTVAEGLGGSKKKGSDEFLVEKKSPLVLPPSFGELPEPGKEPKENITLDKKELSRWHQALAPIEQSWISINPEGQWRMEGLKEILTTIRQELPKDNDL